MATPDQIVKVKTNIRNMITFNNQLYVQGQTKILNAYALLSISDNKDLGLQIGLNLLCGAFFALGGPFGAVGAIAANFLAGIVGGYAVSSPPSLQAAFSSLLVRFQATSEQTTSDLEILDTDPNTYWDTTYSGQVITPFGTYTASAKVSDLATIDFPSETDPQFMDMIYTSQYALDQVIWANLLKNFVLTKFLPSLQYPCSHYSEQKMEENASGYYVGHRSYWNYWEYVHQTNRKGEDISYYDQYQNNIGTGVSAFSDGHLNDAACAYLFIDAYDNVVINPNGLYHRKYVFNNLGIRQTTHTFSNSHQHGH